MINIHCGFQSHILATRVEVQVYLPNVVQYIEEIKDYKEHYSFQPFKTLYLMHGAWDCADQWIENTTVLRQAEEANLALVLPSVSNSFYANTLYGVRYEDYFTEEVMGFVRALFPLSEKREDNYICGVSMGGYGALKAVLKRPDLFSKCAVMSSVVDISYSTRIIRTLGVETDKVVGKWKELRGSEYDLATLLDAMEGNYESIPELLLIACTEDYLYETNVAFAALLKEKGIRHTYKEYPGLHEWKVWEEHLPECIQFFKD